MAILPIITHPDTNLRRRSQEIELVDDGVRKMMHDFLETMYHSTGIGLAAVQVNQHRRIFVIDLRNCDDEERPAGFFPLFISNPQIVEHSTELIVAEEGCLSIPGEVMDVARPHCITLKYLDYDNQERFVTSQGWLARVIQHENDHLDGKLIIDYLSVMKRQIIDRKLKKLKRLPSIPRDREEM